MSHRRHVATPLAALLGLLLAANVWSQETTVYHAFTRLDPVSATVIEDAFVVVQGARVARVGSGTPPANDGWSYVDMSGRMCTPAFRRGKCCGSRPAAPPNGSGWQSAPEASRPGSQPTSCF
jgi:hypothetical protein